MSTFTAISLTAAAALMALHVPPGFPAAEGLDTPFSDIPNVAVTFYDVTGRSAAAIRRSINAARPTDPNDAMRVDGLTHWTFEWRWRHDGQGRRAASAEDVTFRAMVTVPRLTGEKVSPKLREQFDRYLQSLLAHEDGHVRSAWLRRGEILAAINANCGDPGAAAQAVVKAIAAQNVAYDKATRHGATTIIPFG